MTDFVAEGGWSDVLGLPVTSGPRLIDEDDLGLVSTLTWAISELHTNKELMRDSSYGERLFAGPALTGLVTGLHRASGGHGELLARHYVNLGRMQRMDARYVGPVRAFDQIVVVTTAVTVGPATIDLCDVATNQRGEIVLRMDRTHELVPAPTPPTPLAATLTDQYNYESLDWGQMR